MTSLFIILFMFIHNSSSKNGRKTTASKVNCSRIASAPAVGEFLQFWLSARFPLTNFDTKIVNYVLKLVLPKGNTVNFSHFYLTFIAKLFFRVFLVGVYSCTIVFLQSVYFNVKSKYIDAI